MVLLDCLIEISAPRFDFWMFEDEIAPLQNYYAWFIVSSIAHWWYQSFEIKTNSKISSSYNHLFISIFLCFFI